MPLLTFWKFTLAEFDFFLGKSRKGDLAIEKSWLLDNEARERFYQEQNVSAVVLSRVQLWYLSPVLRQVVALPAWHPTIDGTAGNLFVLFIIKSQVCIKDV